VKFKASELSIGEVVTFIFIVGVIGGWSLAVMITCGMIGCWKKLFDVKDQP
jgi:hypothetical protein